MGIGGFTLGGGTSPFSNKYGWALDNVYEYEVSDDRSHSLVPTSKTHLLPFSSLIPHHHRCFAALSLHPLSSSGREGILTHRQRLSSPTAQLPPHQKNKTMISTSRFAAAGTTLVLSLLSQSAPSLRVLCSTPGQPTTTVRRKKSSTKFMISLSIQSFRATPTWASISTTRISSQAIASRYQAHSVMQSRSRTHLSSKLSMRSQHLAGPLPSTPWQTW